MTVFEVRTYNPKTKKAGRRIVREFTFQNTAEETCRAIAERKEKPHAVTCGKQIVFTCDPGPRALRELLRF